MRTITAKEQYQWMIDNPIDNETFADEFIYLTLCYNYMSNELEWLPLVIIPYCHEVVELCRGKFQDTLQLYRSKHKTFENFRRVFNMLDTEIY